jgi:hypothetical protein
VHLDHIARLNAWQGAAILPAAPLLASAASAAASLVPAMSSGPGLVTLAHPMVTPGVVRHPAVWEECPSNGRPTGAFNHSTGADGHRPAG